MEELKTNNKDLVKQFRNYSKQIQKITEHTFSSRQNLIDLIDDRKKIPYFNIKGTPVNLQSIKLISILDTFISKYDDDERIELNLNASILRKTYGADYKVYMKYLCDNGIIYQTGNHCVNRFSKRYSLRRATINSDSVKIVTTNKKIIQKKRDEKLIKLINAINYNRLDHDVIAHVLESFKHISIEKDDAEEYLKENVSDNKLFRNLLSVDSIAQKIIWLTIDDNSRCYTSLTVLKSEVRKNHLLIEGERTKEIDISNSQPFFLSLLLKEHLDKVDFLNIDEYEFFKNLVKNRQFYNYFNKNLGSDIVKKKVFQILFGNNRYDFNSKYAKHFKSLFPTIYEFIIWYKKQMNQYQALANVLQKSESNFIFGTVLKETIQKYPHIKFFTVHDSIVVKESEYENVKEIFDKHIDLIHRKM